MGWMAKGGEARSRALKVRNTIWHAHSAKADATSAAANSTCNWPATVRRTAVETTTTTVTAAAVPSSKCYGTERHGCDPDYQSNYLLYFHAFEFDLALLGRDSASAGFYSAT